MLKGTVMVAIRVISGNGCHQDGSQHAQVGNVSNLVVPIFVNLFHLVLGKNPKCSVQNLFMSPH